jgi:hypothetical protein
MNRIVQTGSGTHPDFYSKTIVFPVGVLSGLGVKLTIHLRLVPRLRMSGATPPSPPNAFMAWTETTLLLPDLGDIRFELLPEDPPS